MEVKIWLNYWFPHTNSLKSEHTRHNCILCYRFIFHLMVLTQTQIGFLNTNKVRAILYPRVLEFQQAVFPELYWYVSLF